MSNQDSGSSPVVLHFGDDPAMQEAIKRARQTFRIFWRELSWEYRRIVPALGIAAVKIAFSDPPEQAEEGQPAVEQMWVNEVEFDGKHITGTLLNSPNWLTSVKEGDSVNVPPGRMSDWMYTTLGDVYGAFTVQLLRSKMGRAERAQHDAAWGLNFGDPAVVRLVPPDYIDQKEPGFFARLFGAKALPQKPEEVVAREHPMAVNMTGSLLELLKSNPQAVAETDDRGFTLLHSLSLAGAAAGVKILLKHGANPTLPAKNGMTPLSLARTLGWNDVVAILEAKAAPKK